MQKAYEGQGYIGDIDFWVLGPYGRVHRRGAASAAPGDTSRGDANATGNSRCLRVQPEQHQEDRGESDAEVKDRVHRERIG